MIGFTAFFWTNGSSGRHSLPASRPRSAKDFWVSRRSRVTGARSGTYRPRRHPTTNSRNKSVHCRLEARALERLTFQPGSDSTGVPRKSGLAFRCASARARRLSVYNCKPFLVNAREGEGYAIQALLKIFHHKTRMNSRATQAPRVLPLEIPRARRSAIQC